MNRGEAPQTERSRFIQVLLMFVLVGPLIGGVIPYLVMNLLVLVPAMIAIHGVENIFMVLRAAFITLAAGLLYAVLLQILPAVLAGLAIAAWDHLRRRSSAWLSAAAGVLAGIASMLLYRALDWPAEFAGSFISLETVVITLSSLVGSVACWWLTRPRPAGIDAMRRPVSIDGA